MREIDRLLFQAIDAGRLDILVAGITKCIKTPLVGQDEDDVGLLGSGMK